MSLEFPSWDSCILIGRRWNLSACFAKRNHYNPCFWTALWNTDYYDAFLAGREADLVARKQTVHSLNAHSGKILKTSVERVHFDKGLGVAELTPAYMKRFAARWFPGGYQKLARYVDAHPDTLYIDFEDVLNGVERRGLYDSILKAARSVGISNPEHKGFITAALIIHATRSHEMTTTALERAAEAGLGRFDYFWNLKNAWGDPLTLARAGHPLAGAKWVLYRTKRHRFPLCDSPVMIERNKLTAILSPRLLLRIDLGTPSREDQWEAVDGISSGRFRQFQRLAIASTYREIIFSDTGELARWRDTSAFQERMKTLVDPTTARRARQEGAARVLWALGGFGVVGPDFEEWVAPYFEK